MDQPKTLCVRLPEPLVRRIDEYVRGRDALTSRTAGIRLLLEDALSRAGHPTRPAGVVGSSNSEGSAR